MKKKAEELEKEILELIKKYKAEICYISIVKEDDDSETTSICGNMCFNCASETLIDYIKEESILHARELH